MALSLVGKKKGPGRPRLPPIAPKSPTKKKKLKQWTEESMIAAIRTVKEDGTAILTNMVCHELLFKTESSVKSFMELSQGLNHYT